MCDWFASKNKRNYPKERKASQKECRGDRLVALSASWPKGKVTVIPADAGIQTIFEFSLIPSNFRSRQFDFSFFKNPSSSIALTMLGSIMVAASSFESSGRVRLISVMIVFIPSSVG